MCKAGASLVHPHAQMVALPILPDAVHSRLSHQAQYFATNRKCVCCDVLDEVEKHKNSSNDRIVLETSENHIRSAHSAACVRAYSVRVQGRFQVSVPFAAAYPHQLLLLPKRHEASFLEIGPKEMRDFALTLKKSLQLLHRGLGDVDFNLMIHSSPPNDLHLEHDRTPFDQYVHWHAEIYPKETRGLSAGFEFCSGMHANAVLPEASASFLRSFVPELEELA